ncbi:MAG TPA: hypothetical protein VMK84_32285, partial [Streptosporangiaceae bacterium]|nr:hypothetical protein [Streptosporangiaceae bacterium]
VELDVVHVTAAPELGSMQHHEHVVVIDVHLRDVIAFDAVADREVMEANRSDNTAASPARQIGRSTQVRTSGCSSSSLRSSAGRRSTPALVIEYTSIRASLSSAPMVPRHRVRPEYAGIQAIAG